MYAVELQDLLAELRFFLGETLCREKLGGIAEAGRQRLVSLLDVHFEHQRQLLTKNQTQPRAKSPSTPAYLDMTRSSPRKSTSRERPNLTESTTVASCYEQVSVMPDVLDSGGGSGSWSSSVVGAVSASALRYCAVHTGSLGRRTRLLFLGQMKRHWAALANRTLYLYNSDGDSKPSIQLDIAGYQARPLIAPNPKKEFTFELVSPGNKTYQFVASSSREMDTWVEAVNLACKEEDMVPVRTSVADEMSPSNRQLPSVPHNPVEMYDTPDSRIRPVLPVHQEYETMAQQLLARTHYSVYQCIDEKGPPHTQLTQEQLYKNIGCDVADDSMYYNLAPGRPQEETIYQTISEDLKPSTFTADQRLKNQPIMTTDGQLYEPVNGGSGSSDDSRASR